MMLSSKPLTLPVLLVVILAALLPFGFSSGSRKTNRMITPQVQTDVIPGRIVIKFKEDLNLGKKATFSGNKSLDNLLTKNKAVSLQQVASGYANILKTSTGTGIQNIYYAKLSGISPAIAAEEIAEHPTIEYAEPLYYDHLHATPNDSMFSQQQHFNVIQAPQAWDITKGENGDVIIAIIDGGTDLDHPDLQVRFWINPGEIAGNGIDDDGNGFTDDINGWNFANDSPDPTGLPNTPTSANHGTHTAGITNAVTDNLTGVAGAAWNATLMAINASAADQDNTIEFGYDGILYAANNGADVISLSWGRSGAPSQFQQDVVNTAIAMGATIVASAGNANNANLNYPGGYDNVMAVAATNNSDQKAGFSNFGRWVDISAPGVSILSTYNNGNYASISGTSMSTPLVAGIVGLVRTANPQLGPLQAAEQVRVTADNIDSQNPSFAQQLGKGRLNAFKALTEVLPSIRITDVRFEDANSDGVIQPGETVEVFLTLKNHLAPASNVSLTLKESDGFISVTNGSGNIPSIGTQEEITLTQPFVVTSLATTPSGYPVEFTVEFTAAGYEDYDSFLLTVLPSFGTANINNIQVSVTNVGRIGFADPNNGGGGIGFTFQNGTNLLFDGGLLAGTSPSQISSGVRASISGNYDDDFSIASEGDLRIFTPGQITDQESIGIFEDAQANNPMDIRIIQETFAQSGAPNDDFILFRYTIENTGNNPLNNFHFGFYFDWDIDEGSFDTNEAAFDASRSLGYCFDTSDSGPATYVGMSYLTEGIMHYRAIDNDETVPGNPWGVYDGFSNAEKWESLTGLNPLTATGPGDVSNVVAAGPFTIPTDNTLELGFALVAGTDLIDLQKNADAAKEFWTLLFTTAIDDREPVLPDAFALRQNYPNPFNPTTTIKYELPVPGDVDITIYNMMGQKIRTLMKETREAGFHSATWNGLDDSGHAAASGVYVYRLRTGAFVQSRKMLLLR